MRHPASHCTATPGLPLYGTMNDYAIYIATFHLHALSVKLSETPVGPLGYDRPRDVAR